MKEKSTVPEVVKRLFKDLNLPNNELGKTAAHLIAACMDLGYIEADVFRERYKDLVCEWCGKLHISERCLRKLKGEEGSL